MRLMEPAEEVGLQISAAATLTGVLVEKKAAMMMTSQGKAKGLESIATNRPHLPATFHLVS
jgi:hypothetical protein